MIGRRLAIGAATSSLLLGGAGRAGERCSVATKDDSPVAQACRRGGREAAQETMKDLVARAKAHGTVFRCAHCHESTTTFRLRSNARTDFQKLVSAARR